MEFSEEIKRKALKVAHVHLYEITLGDLYHGLSLVLKLNQQILLYPLGWYSRVQFENLPPLPESVRGPFPTESAAMEDAFIVNNLREIAEQITKVTE